MAHWLSRLLLRTLAAVFCVFFFCEYVIYFVAIHKCQWPSLPQMQHEGTVVKMMILADTHLLGIYRGHWFDKLRREWQMYRSFQSAQMLFNPDHVVFLGDLFDEGLWGPDAIFKSYAERFKQIFDTPDSTKLHVIVGNHDIGFHNSIRPFHEARFVQHFNTSSVEFKVINDMPFITINSMALEGDGCFLCKPATEKLEEIDILLKCSQEPKYPCPNTTLGKKSKKYVRPIIFQHFPLYRESDKYCEGSDIAPYEEREVKFRPKWDCLGMNESQWILKHLNPRLIMSGHTHHGCVTLHNEGIPEYSVASFSWRNRNNPSFYLAKFTTEDFALEKCFLPEESTVISIYTWALVAWIFLVLLKYRNIFCTVKRKFI